jgi:hypothetical protein
VAYNTNVQVVMYGTFYSLELHRYEFECLLRTELHDDNESQSLQSFFMMQDSGT